MISPHFSAFARSLAADWVARYDLCGRRVIEVGCGRGEFLVDLLCSGAGHVIGIDPLARLSDVPPEHRDRVTVHASVMAEEHAQLEADALVCRHTLEHVSDVA